MEEPAAACAPAGSSRISVWLRLKQRLLKSMVKTDFHFPAAGSGSSDSGDSAVPGRFFSKSDIPASHHLQYTDRDHSGDPFQESTG